MKKIISIFTILLVGLMIDSTVYAKTEVKDLKATVEEEVSYFGDKNNFETDEQFQAYQQYVKLMNEADLSNFENDDKKVNIYIFRGDTCWHCLDEVSWFASQVKDFGNYFNVYTYEIWNNDDNAKLMQNVVKVLKKTNNGVPLTIIGKKMYSGFQESTGQQMLDDIQELYDHDLNDRYDISKYVDLETGDIIPSKESNSKAAIVIIVLTLVLMGGIVGIYYVSKSK